MVAKNGKGEIADLVSVSQFEANETQSACGPFAVALCKYAGPPNKGPRGTAEAVDEYADNAYARIFGSYDISKEAGVVPDQIHTMLLDAGLHYQDLVTITDGSTQDNDIRYIKAALDQGYLVLGEITETSVIDLDLGGSPYGWNTSGFWHYVVYSGYTGNALLTHDGANITGALNGQNQVRQQPRKYNANQIQNRWCTIVCTSWLPHPSPNFDPTQPVNNGGDDPVLQEKLTTLQNAYNVVVTEKNGLVADKAKLTQQLTDIQGKMVTLENAYNTVVAEKNRLIAQVNQLKQQTNPVVPKK